MKTCLFAALALALIATAFAYPYQVIGKSTISIPFLTTLFG
jgi:hypothetical protein